MTVEELIELLKKEDPEEKILVWDAYSDHETDKVCLVKNPISIVRNLKGILITSD